MVSSEAAQRTSRCCASSSGARVPATIARMIRMPVTPVMSETTWWSCTFIVHLHERLLHVLHVRGRVLDDPLSVAPVSVKKKHLVARAETSAQQAVLMELLQPLRIVHVGLSSGHVLHVARVHKKHLKPARLQDLKDRDPVHAGRLHRDRLDAHAAEPVRHPVEIAAEAPKRANGLLILIAAHRDDVKRRSDVQPCRVLIEREQLSRRSSARLLLFSLHGWTSVGEARSR